MKDKRVLIVAAHPDDEVLGVGGTISKYIANGANVKVLIVTDGSTSQYRGDPELNKIIEAKKAQTQKAAELLGVSEVIYGGLPDMKLDTVAHIEVNAVIEKVIDEFCPDVVFTHFYGDANKDHRCVYESTIVACRTTPDQCVKELYSYFVPSSTDWNVQNQNTVFMPTAFINISGECAEKKYQAMSAYEAELRSYPHPRSVEAIQIFDKANGAHVGVESAECFVVHRLMK